MYVESILALQQKACRDQGQDVRLSLVIMTSDDTHARTQALLDEHSYFGMEQGQLHLLKQEKVGIPTSCQSWGNYAATQHAMF